MLTPLPSVRLSVRPSVRRASDRPKGRHQSLWVKYSYFTVSTNVLQVKCFSDVALSVSIRHFAFPVEKLILAKFSPYHGLTVSTAPSPTYKHTRFVLACSSAQASSAWHSLLAQSHNTPLLPPKILQNHCLQVLLVHEDVLREIKNNAYANFWGVKEVYYGICASSE